MGAIRNIVILVILFSMIFTGLLSVYSELQQEYAFSLDYRFENSTYDAINETTTLTIDMYDTISVNASGQTDDSEANLLKLALVSVKIVPRTLTTVDRIMRNLTDAIGLPAWMRQGFYAIFVMVLLAALIAFFRRWNP